MRIVKSVFDFYINSSLHVALAVLSIACITFLEFKISFDWNLLFFIFFATITGYNFVKYFRLAKFHHRRLADWLQLIQVFSFICFLLMCFFITQLQSRTLFYILIFAGITFLYAVPFLPKTMLKDQQKNLRSIGGLKIYVIALVWAGVTVLLPLLNNGYSINTGVWLTAVQRFFLVIILILPFEIRDLQYDNLRLSTIPQKIGIKNTKITGVVLGVLFVSLEFLKEEPHCNQILISVTVIALSFIFLLNSKEDQNEYYCSFWVESIPMWWLLLTIIF